MKCESCERDFPSVYYFKARGISKECYAKLSEREKDATEPLYQPIPKVRRPKTRLVSFLKGMTTFAMVILAAGGTGITLALIAGMIDPGIYHFESFKDFGLLYEFSSEPAPVMSNLEGLNTLNLTTVAAMNFSLTSRTTILLYFLSKYLILGFTFTIFYMIRQILITLHDGEPFVRENARRIRWVGFAVIGIGLASLLVGGAVFLLLQDPFRMAGAAVTTYWPALIMHAGDALNSVFWGFLVLLISEIFRQAVLLREEQDLTV